MPGALNHSPADVIRRLLIALGHGADPPESDVTSTWPITVGGDPSVPDRLITLVDTAGKDSGRTMTDGEVQEHHGIQIQVRSPDYQDGYDKAREVAVGLDGVYWRTVSIGSSTYEVQSVGRTGDVVYSGKEFLKTKRALFTINALVMVRQV